MPLQASVKSGALGRVGVRCTALACERGAVYAVCEEPPVCLWSKGRNEGSEGADCKRVESSGPGNVTRVKVGNKREKEGQVL